MSFYIPIVGFFAILDQIGSDDLQTVCLGLIEDLMVPNGGTFRSTRNAVMRLFFFFLKVLATETAIDAPILFT